MNSKLINFILSGVVMFLFFLLLSQKCEGDRTATSLSDLQAALNDTITYYTNKDGEKVARISVLETGKVKDFLAVKTKDSTIKKLQSIVSKYEKQIKRNGSATIVGTESNYEEQVKTDVPIIFGKEDIATGDISLPDNTRYISLPYTFSNIDTTWIKLTFKIDEKFTSWTVKTKDELSLVIGEEKQGLFKKRKPFADVTNSNPFTETKNLRTYRVQGLPPKQWHIGPGAFYGMGADLKTQFFIGIGLMYTPINF